MADARPRVLPDTISFANANISWDDIRAFLGVVVHGSMNRAASALGESQATVGRRVTRLEQRLGFALTHRGANRTELTPAGLDLFRMISPMATAAAEIETVRRLHTPRPDAPLRITATTSMSMFLSRQLPTLRAAVAPRELLLLPSRRQMAIERGEADIALRMSKGRRHGVKSAPAEVVGDLMMRHLATIRFAIYGVPAHEGLPMIMTSGAPQVSQQHALARRVAALRTTGPEIDEMYLRYLAVKSGVGIGILPCWLGETDEELVRVYRDEDFMISDEVYLVRHVRSRGDRAVESAIKALVRVFRFHRANLSGEPQP